MKKNKRLDAKTNDLDKSDCDCKVRSESEKTDTVSCEDKVSYSDVSIQGQTSKADTVSSVSEKTQEKNDGGKNDVADIKGTKKFFLATCKYLKKVCYNIFITGLTGMAQGLFATLIVGTIVSQIASYIPGKFGEMLLLVGNTAKILMGAGIGIGVATKFKATTLTTVSSAVAGMIGAYASQILKGGMLAGSVTTLAGVGEPLGAFIGAYFAVFIGSLVAGKTKVDILVTPLCCVLAGGALGLLAGAPVSALMTGFGSLINLATAAQPIIMGIVISALMGIALTLPISSAAIGISLGLSGIAAGAATVGCCCQMVGFAVLSFKENKWGGLVSQGIGTSMLQMPNIIKRPLIWIPPIAASIVLGPISTAVLGMTSNAVGSGMGAAGLVGPIMTFQTMTSSGVNAWIVLLEIAAMYFLLPGLICWALGLLFRKKNWIREGDLKL